MCLKAEKANPKNKKNIEGAVDKLNQISAILYSKYFESSIKKQAFKDLKYYGVYIFGLKSLVSTLNKVEKRSSFSAISVYSHKKEK
jgi:hypothetical protein